MPTVEVRVPTTLKEFYNGCIKTISYSRQTVALDGKTCAYKVTNKQIEIKPGMDIHDNFKYMGEGHQQPGQRSSNLYVNFQPAPPSFKSPDYETQCRYTRDRNNLHYKKRISL